MKRKYKSKKKFNTISLVRYLFIFFIITTLILCILFLKVYSKHIDRYELQNSIKVIHEQTDNILLTNNLENVEIKFNNKTKKITYQLNNEFYAIDPIYTSSIKNRSLFLLNLPNELELSYTNMYYEIKDNKYVIYMLTNDQIALYPTTITPSNKILEKIPELHNSILNLLINKNDKLVIDINLNAYLIDFSSNMDINNLIILNKKEKEEFLKNIQLMNVEKKYIIDNYNIFYIKDYYTNNNYLTFIENNNKNEFILELKENIITSISKF